jgi:uncharacterized phiE125 gp8 family phage protein
MALRLLTASTYGAVVASTDAIAHLRASTADTALINGLRTAAVEYAEMFTRRVFLHSTYRYTSDVWPNGAMDLPRPLFNGNSTNVVVSYLSEGGSTYTVFASTEYHIDRESEPGRLVLKSNNTWPDTALESANAVRVDFVAGYGTTATSGSTAVPQGIKQACLLLTGHWYENRDSVVVGTISSEIEQAVKTLLWANTVPDVP